MKGRTGSTLSRTKYVKCFRVETSCYRVVLRLKFIVTVELLYDQAESDFVQCQTKMRAFASRICSEFKQIELNWNRIVHQNALWSLVFSTTRPWNKQISAPDASQPSSQERWQVADLKHFKTSYIFSLRRIRRVRSNRLPWMTDQIRALITQRNFHHKKAQKTGSSYDWQEYRSLRNRITVTIKETYACTIACFSFICTYTGLLTYIALWTL